MKKKIKILIVSLFLIALIIAITTVNYTKSSATLIQLSPQGSRQMMGYLIKTNTGKLIVIDGGTTDDTEQLMEQIKKNGAKVDYWFLTHVHDDHVGAFTKIVKNTDTEIENIYVSVNKIEWYEQNEPSRLEFTKTFLDTL